MHERLRPAEAAPNARRRLAPSATAVAVVAGMVAVAAAAPADAPAAWPIVIHLDLVRGLRDVDPAPRPLRRPLASQPPAGLDVSSLPPGTWDFGAAPVTRTESLAYAVSADRTVAYFDSDGDRVLEASERRIGPRRMGATRWFAVDGLVRQRVGGETHEDLVPMAVGIPPRPTEHAFSRLDGYRRGTLRVGDRDVAIAVLDRTYRGWFSHPSRDRLFVDVDGDGKLDTTEESHERFRLKAPFPVGPLDLVVEEIGPLGCTLTVGLSPEPARRRRPLTVGRLAPPLRATDLAGQMLDTDRLRGRWVLLDFWATWCKPCLRELPHLEALRTEHPELVVVGISADRDRAALERVVAARGIDWTQVHDEDGALAAAYRVRSYPRSYLLAPDGTIAGKDLRGHAAVRSLEKAQGAWSASSAPPLRASR